MAEEPKVGIVILNYMSYQDTLTMINLIHQKLRYDNYEVIVVDNCSPNESSDILYEAQNENNFHFIKNLKNNGYAAGNNVGIHYAYTIGATYIWIINNDILLPDRAVLQKLVQCMEERTEIGAISPRVFKLSGEEDIPFIKRPNYWEMSIGYLWYARKRRKADLSKTQQIYRAQGCCMLLRVESIKKIGEMDEDTFLYCEEDLLAEKLRLIYKQCWICGETKVIHNHSKTVYSVMDRKSIALNNAKSFSIYLDKYRQTKIPLIKKLVCLIKYTVIYIRY